MSYREHFYMSWPQKKVFQEYGIAAMKALRWGGSHGNTSYSLCGRLKGLPCRPPVLPVSKYHLS
jgi:hypothetical protein